MNNNMGRVNLITRFTCSECGNQLNLSYDAKKPSYGQYEEDGITGAYKMENFISVEPCKRCVNKYKEPLENIQKALSVKL